MQFICFVLLCDAIYWSDDDDDDDDSDLNIMYIICIRCGLGQYRAASIKNSKPSQYIN